MLETLAVSAHHGVHGHESLGVFLLYNLKNALRLAFVRHHQLLKAKSLGIKLLTRAEALGMLMSEYNTSIAISGTHGKTTTTSMVSLILNNAKKDPTIFKFHRVFVL